MHDILRKNVHARAPEATAASGAPLLIVSFCHAPESYGLENMALLRDPMAFKRK